MPDANVPADTATARLLDAGDGAVTVEFGASITPRASAAVASLERAIEGARGHDRLPGVIETVRTLRSLTVLYDPLRTGRAELDPLLRSLLGTAPSTAAEPARRWRLPVCYGGDFGVDLDDVAARCGCSADEVVRLHAGAAFTVRMLGFMPGFPFMSGLPERLSLPRRSEPRVRVPSGSVAVTGTLSAIYPWESPGGWHLLGRCPVPLFDATAAMPVLLAPGDHIGFEPVTPARHAEIDAALRAGSMRAADFLLDARP